ncbi:MAG: alpha/beta hydrolase [Myxococcales bacterium]|nr:alpha/beta hydrolase [Myxococcales bacterium]
MKHKPTKFFSDGLELDASFYLGDTDPGPTAPLVIGCSGFTGLMNIHPERFARSLTPRGFVGFGFDYRGFGKSEGTARYVTTEEQARDIVAAVDFARNHELGKGRKVYLLGWGMAGGLILEASRTLPPLDGLIAMNGFYDAIRVQKAVRGEKEFEAFMAEYHKERAARTASRAPDKADPYHVYPLDPVTKVYVDGVLRKTDGFSGDVNFSFGESLLRFVPERHLDHLAKTPILIAHGATNALHPPAEAHSLKEKYPGPAEVYLLEGAGHTEWMLDENPLFQKMMDRVAAWLAEH